jgi:thiol-disulfide isomerase/thioredoxin
VKTLWAAAGLAALAAGLWFARPAPESPALAALWAANYPDPTGVARPLADFRGRPLVVNFWASWCGPCREEMPEFDALRREYRAHGVEFVGVAIDMRQNVADFLAGNPVSYPVVIGAGAANHLSASLGGRGLPHTVVLDAKGKIALNHVGRLPAAQLAAVLRTVAN